MLKQNRWWLGDVIGFIRDNKQTESYYFECVATGKQIVNNPTAKARVSVGNI